MDLEDSEAYPPKLLDDYLSIARRRAKDALPATALRTRSPATRILLAHAATGGTASLEQLVSAARDGAVTGLQLKQFDPAALTDLARVVALQEVFPEDARDGLALYDLALAVFGQDRTAPLHQGLHAQLAYDQGQPDRAATLLDTYQQVPPRVAEHLRVDLANPFRDPSAGTVDGWLEAFQRQLPAPWPELRPPDGTAPFDRLVTGGVRRIDSAELVSVIVTCYRPGPWLITAIGSLVVQSWSNFEILLVDDGSPPESDPILEEATGLDERIRLVKSRVNRGVYAARNAGLDAANGDFVTFQDSEDWSHPLRLEHQLRPLLANRSLVASLTNGLQVTDDLVLTRPGRPVRLPNLSSIALRRDAVLQRVGYFDVVQKGADSEYHERIQAAFGAEAVCRDRNHVYALIRPATGSLSRAEFRSGWMHPAQAAYISSYHHWHERIRSGTATAYLPQQPLARPFAAPAYLQYTGQAPARRFDVVFASDWRRFGGPQKSMLEEIRAVTKHGMRVAVVHLEALRFMTTKAQDLCRPIQELINAGTVEHLLLCEEADVSLLIVRYPPVLQFAASEPSALRAKQVIILANQAPSEQDGTDRRYTTVACNNTARTLFSVKPRWCPQGPAIREVLEAAVPPSSLTPFDMPGIIDSNQWWLDRRRFRLDRPVIGRHSRDNWTKWPGDRETLLSAYPDSDEFDVRVLGGGKTARTVLGTATFPPNWVVYEYDEVEVRSFLNQIDYFVYFPHPTMVEAFGRAVLEAMATGCVVVLPHRFSATFGEGAVYCDIGEVPDLVRALHADRKSYLEQSQRGQERVRKLYSHDGYYDLVSSIIYEP